MRRSLEKPKSKARVLVADNHPIVRAGLVGLINLQDDLICAGEAGNGSDTKTAAAKLKPDLVILDLQLKGGGGLELIKSLKAQFPELRILVLSQSEALLHAERALRAGACGYLLKDQPAEEVLRAIRAVLSGQVFLSRGTAAEVLHQIVARGTKAPRPSVDCLTDRELHILHLLGLGRSTRAIASELNLSFKTIETHRENIKRKLGLRGAAQLLHYAAQWVNEDLATPEQGTTE